MQLQCQSCKIKPRMPRHGMCDTCLVFADTSYDFAYIAREKRKSLPTDDIVTETEFKWREEARISREIISAKYPPRLLTN